VTVSLPYPNPVRRNESVRVDLNSVCPKNVRWAVYTSAYRKVRDGASMADGRGHARWDLKDSKKKPVAPGLYYWTFIPDGQKPTTRTVLVLP